MGKEIELIVGRNNSCDIKIDKDLISGRHLRILKLHSTVFVEDLGSTNGTTVDGEVLSKGVKKMITLESHIVLAKKITLDLNHYKIQALELPHAIIDSSCMLDSDETEKTDMFKEGISSFSSIPTPPPKRKRGLLLGIVSIIAIIIGVCLSGKVDFICNKFTLKEELKVETPKETPKPYVIVAPKFMGSSKSNSSVFFANKTDKSMSVKLIDIAIEGIPYDGIVVPLNGKGKFIVFGNDTYEYRLIFEESVTKDLDVGKYSCKVIFKVTIEGQKTKMETIKFPIEIINN